MNIAIVGGGKFTARVLQQTLNEFSDHQNIHAKMIAVADPDLEAPGMVLARELGHKTFQDFTELYEPQHQIELIIVLSPDQELLYDILATKPHHIRVMSYHTFQLFWHSINLEADKQRQRSRELEAILDGIEDFIVVINPDMTISQANKSFLEHMGYSREEIIGRKCYEVFQKMNRQCQCDREQIVCPLQEVIEQRISGHRIFPRVNRAGQVVYIEVAIHPIWDSQGNLSKFIEISRDVTKREKEDQEINRKLEELVEERTRELKKRQEEMRHQDKMASLGKLAASVVHEINNPVSGMLNLILLMRRITEEGELREKDLQVFLRYLKLMETETRRVSRIASNLLSFSRESRLETSQVNVNSLLEEVLFLNANFFKINHVQVVKELDPELPEILGDGEQLKQVFMNLVSNAVEAMEEQKEQRTLWVKTSPGTHQVCIVFQDSGCGIPGNDSSKIFDPFFSTKSRGKGVGLGLSVAYGIIQQHSGDIEVNSGADRGTTITITLPLTQPKEKYE